MYKDIKWYLYCIYWKWNLFELHSNVKQEKKRDLWDSEKYIYPRVIP